MIEVAHFADVYEAEIAAARLRSEGFNPTLSGADHARADPLILQALGGIRLNVPDSEAVAVRARLASLRDGTEALEDEPEPGPRPDRTLPAKVMLGSALLALLIGG
jgi:hypothetical protein